MTGRHPCDGCGKPEGRREFLRGMAGLAIVFVTGTRRPVSSDVEYPIPAADGATIDREHDVILVRHAGQCIAFALSCPHQNTALKWLAEDGRFQCPKHKSRYTPDGVFVSGRATRNMDRLPIRRAGDKLVVDVDRVFESDKDAAGWRGAVVAVK